MRQVKAKLKGLTFLARGRVPGRMHNLRVNTVMKIIFTLSFNDFVF